MTNTLPELGAVLYSDKKVTPDTVKRGLVVDIVIGNTSEGRICHGPFIIAVDNPDQFRTLLNDTQLLNEAVSIFREGKPEDNNYGLVTLRLEDIPKEYREDWRCVMNEMQSGRRKEKVK